MVATVLALPSLFENIPLHIFATNASLCRDFMSPVTLSVSADSCLLLVALYSSLVPAYS